MPSQPERTPPTPSVAKRPVPSFVDLIGDVPFDEAVARFKKQYLTELLEACGFNISKAARFARVERKNFTRLLKRFGVTTSYCRVSRDGEVCSDTQCPLKLNGPGPGNSVTCPRPQRPDPEEF